MQIRPREPIQQIWGSENWDTSPAIRAPTAIKPDADWQGIKVRNPVQAEERIRLPAARPVRHSPQNPILSGSDAGATSLQETQRSGNLSPENPSQQNQHNRKEASPYDEIQCTTKTKKPTQDLQSCWRTGTRREQETRTRLDPADQFPRGQVLPLG